MSLRDLSYFEFTRVKCQNTDKDGVWETAAVLSNILYSLQLFNHKPTKVGSTVFVQKEQKLSKHHTHPTHRVMIGPPWHGTTKVTYSVFISSAQGKTNRDLAGSTSMPRGPSLGLGLMPTMKEAQVEGGPRRHSRRAEPSPPHPHPHPHPNSPPPNRQWQWQTHASHITNCKVGAITFSTHYGAKFTAEHANKADTGHAFSEARARFR